MFSVEMIMKSDVAVVTPQDRMKHAIVQMGKHRVSGLCVIDDLDQRHVVGVITEYDLLRAYKEDRIEERISQIMSPNVTTVTVQATLDELIDLFLEQKIRRVFVANDGVLQGVISRRDLVTAAQCRNQVEQFAQMGN